MLQNQLKLMIMEEEKKEAPKDRVIPLMQGLDIIKHEEQEMTVKDFLEQSLSAYDAPINVQASFPSLDQKIDNYQRSNGFVRAFMIAYGNHLPLEIGPDDVWLIVCQGFCAHILENSEKLRKEFVDFDGKKELKVQLDHFTFGSPDNDWTQAFSGFSEQIKEIIGAKMHSIFVHKFSTTTPLQSTIYEATLLSAMQKYFDYSFSTCCGIPKVRLLGKSEDWIDLRTKVEGIGKYGIDWWIVKLLPIIDKFVAAAVNGESDPDFWNAAGKIVDPGQSGDFDGLNGWLGNFFPYLNSKRNEKLRDLKQILETMKTFNPDDLDSYWGDEQQMNSANEELKKKMQERIERFDRARQIYMRFPDFSEFPVGVTEAPFKWKYYEQQYDMLLISGFIGIQRTADGYIKPKIGWGIGQKTKSEPKQYEEEEEEEEDENQEDEEKNE